MALLNYVMMALVAIVTIVGLRMFYVWYTRVRRSNPHWIWNGQDCEHLTTTTVDGTTSRSHGP